MGPIRPPRQRGPDLQTWLTYPLGSPVQVALQNGSTINLNLSKRQHDIHYVLL